MKTYIIYLHFLIVKLKNNSDKILSKILSTTISTFIISMQIGNTNGKMSKNIAYIIG